MSLLIGPLSGALVAGGIYYGFSNLINTRTEQHRRDLHALSTRLTENPTLVQAPTAAASRIPQQQFTSLLAERWNQEIRYLFTGFWSWEQRAENLGRNFLYGRESHDSPSTSPKSSE